MTQNLEILGGNFFVERRKFKLKNFIKILVLYIAFSTGSNAQVTEEWVQRFTSDSVKIETVNDMFVDAAGNVYVTGENALYSGGANELLTIKYAADGMQLWANRFQYIQNFSIGGYDIVTDNSGNVYVTGDYYQPSPNGNNIFLVKYSPGGSLAGQTFYHAGSEQGRKIGLDNNGKIIIGGYTYFQDTVQFVALKFEQNLDLVWATRWSNPSGFNSSDKVNDMAIDGAGNVILAGTSNFDYATVKLNSAGVVQWAKLYNSGDEQSRGIVTDNAGSVYVTGESGTIGLPNTYDFCTIKYSANGNEEWVRKFSDGDGENAYDIAIDNSSDLYITGVSYSSSNIQTVKYNSSGVMQWEAEYNGTGNSIDKGVAIAVDAAGNAFVSGNSIGSGTGYDIAIIKYQSSSIGIQNISSEIPDKFSLSQNFPNPFNPTTKIRFSIGGFGSNSSQNVTLAVFDANGKEVEMLFSGRLAQGTYEASFNGSKFSSGVYFYRLQTEGATETRKMVMTK